MKYSIPLKRFYNTVIFLFTTLECKVGFYGYKCYNRCGHCSDNLMCHHVNGSCPNGCQAGWNGKTCMESMKYSLVVGLCDIPLLCRSYKSCL